MKIRINKLQLNFYANILEERTGICSQKYTDSSKHILLWDFDNGTLSKIISELKKLQIKYKLPKIYIIESSVNSYHAYCFVSRSFRETIHILSDTSIIDMVYLRLGMVRGYYTLRITPRRNDKFRLVKVLKSAHLQEMDFSDTTINKYLTSNKGGHNNG